MSAAMDDLMQDVAIRVEHLRRQRRERIASAVLGGLISTAVSASSVDEYGVAPHVLRAAIRAADQLIAELDK